MRYIPYARQSIDPKDIKGVVDVLGADYITQGPKIREFEKRIADYCGVRYAVALNSGTSALHAACFVSGVTKGDEVITSPISFAASSNCVLYCGGRPRFADILENTVTIDPSEIQKNITYKTKAIIPVDFAGHPAELKEIRNIARKNKLIVIEDAAHALGAEYRGKKVGSCNYSDMAILSFHAVKHITTGEGGMVLTNKRDFYEKLLMFRTHGITRDKRRMINKNQGQWFYEMQFLGFNYRITDLQCALGLRQLDKLGHFLERRRRIADFYKKEFKETDAINCLEEKKDALSSWHIFPIRVKRYRDKVFQRLRSKGIGVNLHYIPIHLHPYYAKLGYKKGICPKAVEYYKETITLPLYPDMSDAQMKRVVRLTKNAIDEANSN